MKLASLVLVNLFFAYTSALPALAQNARLGEPTVKLVYAIKKLGFKVGEATLAFYPQQKLDGQVVDLIAFQATAPKVYDEEKIYVHPQSLTPVRVERDLDLPMSGKEKITEVYESDKRRIVITKVAGGKTTEQVINKAGQIDNIYGIIFRYRAQGSFNLGDTVEMNLPTADIALRLVRTESLKAAGKIYRAYYMESVPSKYRIWFDVSADHLPLRIDGAVGFGSTSMVLQQ